MHPRTRLAFALALAGLVLALPAAMAAYGRGTFERHEGLGVPASVTASDGAYVVAISGDDVEAVGPRGTSHVPGPTALPLVAGGRALWPSTWVDLATGEVHPAPWPANATLQEAFGDQVYVTLSSLRGEMENLSQAGTAHYAGSEAELASRTLLRYNLPGGTATLLPPLPPDGCFSLGRYPAATAWGPLAVTCPANVTSPLVPRPLWVWSGGSNWTRVALPPGGLDVTLEGQTLLVSGLGGAVAQSGGHVALLASPGGPWRDLGALPDVRGSRHGLGLRANATAWVLSYFTEPAQVDPDSANSLFDTDFHFAWGGAQPGLHEEVMPHLNAFAGVLQVGTPFRGGIAYPEEGRLVLLVPGSVDLLLALPLAAGVLLLATGILLPRLARRGGGDAGAAARCAQCGARRDPAALFCLSCGRAYA